MVTTRRTPAASARRSTSGRSSANLASSRWAWVSMSSSTSATGRHRLASGQLLELVQVAALHLQVLLHYLRGVGIGKEVQAGLQSRHRPPLLVDQARHQEVEAHVVNAREIWIRTEIRQVDVMPPQKCRQPRGRLRLLVDQLLQ